MIMRNRRLLAQCCVRASVFLPANAGSVTVVTPFLLVGFFPHVVRSGVPLHRGKLQLKLSRFYLLVSLVTFILHVFSYVPLYVIYLYMYTYVHTLSLRITSLFFSLSPFQLLFLSLYYSIYIFPVGLFQSSLHFFYSIDPGSACYRFSYVTNYVCQCLIIPRLFDSSLRPFKPSILRF